MLIYIFVVFYSWAPYCTAPAGVGKGGISSRELIRINFLDSLRLS